MASKSSAKKWLSPETYELKGQIYYITADGRHIKIGVTHKTEGNTSQGVKA